MQLSHSMDGLMEEASDALSRMAYQRCETLCLEALTLARDAENWRYYARILMPLQEARRQRRMIAADGAMRLGTADVDAAAGDQWITQWLDENPAGCVAISEPVSRAAAQAMCERCREAQQYVEVLYIVERNADVWTVSDVTG